jgi:ABC-2 type transport system permease protein
LIVAGRRLVWKSEPDTRLAAIVTVAAQRVRWSERAAALGLSPAQAAALLDPAPLPARRLDAPDPDRDSRETIAMIGFLLLLTVVIFYGNAVAEGVAQEKGGRVMEVLLSRIRAQDLLTGKVVGIGLVGLSQVLVAALAGVAAAVAVQAVDVPAAVPAALAMTVLWFALGYAFWSVVFAAAGALVSRVEDLQAATLPLTWILTLSGLSAVFVQDAPDAWYIRLASVVPITAPFVMPVRAALGDIAAWEVLLAVALMVLAIRQLVRIAADVYTGGLLRSGGRPRLAELRRAARSS